MNQSNRSVMLRPKGSSGDFASAQIEAQALRDAVLQYDTIALFDSQAPLPTPPSSEVSFVEVLSRLTREDEWESMYKSTESVPGSDWRILRMTAGESKYNMAVQRFGDDRMVLVSAVDLSTR